MKTMKSLREDGFTLVELMVVVAIIGLLSAVAIPNFKKYQAKSKMAEAKLQLSAVYTAETAFFSDYNIYGHCLAYMGYDPNMERANRYYAVGFANGANIDATAYGAAVNSGLQSVDCPQNFASSVAASYNAASVTPGGINFYPAGKGVGAAIANAITFLPSSVFGVQSSADTMLFTISAGGVIDGATASMATTGNSQLTINQNKVITVVRNGF